MKIGVDATCWSNKRGFGRFTRELLSSMVSADDKNEYFFFIDSKAEINGGMPPGAKTIVVETSESPMEAASSESRRSVSDLLAMSRAVFRHDLDIFFFPAVYSFFPVFNRAKIVVTIHDVIADHNPKLVFPSFRSKIFWKLKQNAAVRQADMIITVSEYSRQKIRDYFSLPESRLRVISEGAREVFKQLPMDADIKGTLGKYGIADGDRFLIYVGGISPHKNLDTLVGAFASLETDDVKLVLVGDYTDDPFHSAYPALKQQISELGIGGNVIFTGYVPDEELVRLYNGAELLVFPSLEEGFGLPALEAMACGTPVAASNCSSLPEVIGDAGVFFDPRDAADVARVIGKVLSSAETRSGMSEKSLARSKDFLWDKAAADTISIFSEVAAV